MNEPEKLIPLHGGYQKLKRFQVTQLAYDVTMRRNCFKKQKPCDTNEPRPLKKAV
jgi:hypothetical protein